MKCLTWKSLTRRLVLCSLIVAVSCVVRAGELPQAAPESQGVSPTKLAAAEKAVKELVDQKEYAGAVTLVARNGKIVEWQAVGLRDLATNKPMQKDTIVRIYSMTKPITTVAAMILNEEGKFQLDDPVSKYLPELKSLRVYAGPDKTEPARREITIRDLMRHTSGFTYGLFGDSAVDKMYMSKGVLGRSQNLQEFVSRLSTLPLKYQPGTKFNYSVSTDVLGRLVEVTSGQTLDAFFAERIFKPLDMVDSGFFVPADKVDRFSVNYGPERSGSGLRVVDGAENSALYLKLPKFLSGGGGMVSTTRDYARFCQMMLNGGELEGTRILKAETVAQMTRNQLPPEALPMSMPSLMSVPDKSLGFGLGFGVRTSPSASDPSVIPGEYFWGGYASTGFIICPRDKSVIISMAQYLPLKTKLADTFKRGADAAIESTNGHAPKRIYKAFRLSPQLEK
ncbi:MAG TPA: serine hydrolase domain-containing protein [Planctomycetaceae bacterium]|jgi:CubicO group peptidase (beta-lactamase class C family)|nr:serine hydrolase domain-containing protein [Planctomycetaceae bacterium]